MLRDWAEKLHKDHPNVSEFNKSMDDPFLFTHAARQIIGESGPARVGDTECNSVCNLQAPAEGEPWKERH